MNRVQEIMDINIENLIEKQHTTLKEHTIDILQDIICLLVQEEYEQVKNKLCYSPAGDYMGTDTYHINFSYYEKGEADLYDMLDKLKELKSKLNRDL